MNCVCMGVGVGGRWGEWGCVRMCVCVCVRT